MIIQRNRRFSVDLSALTDWFFSLGETYNVNPFIFGALYIGTIPFSVASIVWLARNYRRGKSVILPLLSIGICFISAYLYLIIVGRNVPVWVYFVLAAMIILGITSTIKKVRKRIKEEPNEA